MAKNSTGVAKPPKPKATFYEVSFRKDHFYECIDMWADEVIEFGAGFELKEFYDIDGWTVHILRELKKINVVYRRNKFAVPVLNKTFDLQRCRICLYAGPRGDVRIFYQPEDFESILDSFGINEKNQCDKLKGNYAGDWCGDALVSEKTPEKKFWAFSDDKEANCVLDYYYTEETRVISYKLTSPFDSCLTSYEGEISYRPTAATWVITCQQLRTQSKISSTVALYLSPQAKLEAIVDWIEAYLSRTGYTQLIDCFSVVPLQ